ncbi:uncharacterized protein LOC121726496 [Aricia agestis]|uniref:uncharacterized protein LOC121726496 n=1 Tax=Aricia agestis TaxID=91739 RepID=UPI001C204B8D|nr:uncharacterized protein LOC121726496 [Aricia agestis]
MFFFLLLALVAAAGAAPRRDRLPYGRQAALTDLDDLFTDELFDAAGFWNRLHQEMVDLDAAIAELGRRFPVDSPEAGVDGDKYKVKIPLAGFEEKDIKVKANEGVLMVQAVHEEGARQRYYMHTVTLPAGVDPTGSWTFADGLLAVEFPLKDRAAPATTPAPAHSREEMGGGDDATEDADVGLSRGDQADKQVETNEIPGAGVEATTYAVDLKGDVEFVPVHYKQAPKH